MSERLDALQDMLGRASDGREQVWRPGQPIEEQALRDGILKSVNPLEQRRRWITIGPMLGRRCPETLLDFRSAVRGYCR